MFPRNCADTALLLSVCLLIGGCAGWERTLIEGKGFHHLTAVPDRQTQTRGDILHVYIHGDGVPFTKPTQVAANPTPRRPYVLALMQADPAPSVMLGRPCYFNVPDRCHPRWWTTHRYAPEVVESLAAAVAKMSAGRRVVLIGYSGGGTLALLIAPQIDNLHGVITVAANLGIDTWTELHGYTPLEGSLNPLQRAYLSVDIAQVHFFGARDAVVPPALLRDWLQKLPQDSVLVLPDHRHDCCWHRDWPDLLATALGRF